MADTPAGVEQRLFVAVADTHVEVAAVAQRGFYLIAKMMQIDHQLGNSRGVQPVQLMHDQGFAMDLEQGFRRVIRQRAEPFASSGGQNHSFHRRALI